MVGYTSAAGKTDMKQLRSYQSLSFKALMGLTIAALWLMLGIYFIMAFNGKPFIAEESRRLVEQAGNTAVAEIHAYINSIEALTATLATTVEHLPKSVDTMMNTIPALLDFHGDQSIAGGGVWPEPYAFNAKQERRSFFWGRDSDGTLKYYDDYNQSKTGYHHEEWYVPSRYTQPGKCFWSRSYMDPYSMQPMVTCTVSTYVEKKFTGTVTVDVKLEGLHAMVNNLQSLTGGYVFIVDRNNKFITFPEPKLVRTTNIGSKEFITVHEFVERRPEFANIATDLTAFNQEILDIAKQVGYDTKIATAIAAQSHQIEADEANLIAAMLTTDGHVHGHQTYLHATHTFDNDYRLQRPVTTFYFHVPNTFWKLIIVKPTQEIGMVANQVTSWLILYLSLMILLVLVGAYFLLQSRLIWPLLQTTDAMAKADDLVAEKAFNRLPSCQATYRGHDEIGVLARIFNKLSAQVVSQHQALKAVNNALEDKVKERTAQLEHANEEISALNSRLKAENLRMGTELEVAKHLQQMVLPRPEEFKQIPDLDIAGFMQPADEVGGDYYDILHHEGRIKIGIGDVTGHGLESGVLMLMVQTAVRTLLANNVTEPQTFLRILNKVIYANVKRMDCDKNLTLSLLDYDRGRLMISGQHEEILVIRQNGEIERLDTINLGFMLGLQEDITRWVNQHEIQLHPGEGIVLYTDGITEAMDYDGECFGVERLCEAVRVHWQASAHDIQNAVINTLRAHIGTNKPLDDITLVVIKQKVPESAKAKIDDMVKVAA